jgi:PAS domain S-box-containing protein
MQALNKEFRHYLIDESPDCIKVLDLQGQLLYMNPGGQKTMEIDDFSQCREVPWADFWQAAEKEKVYEAINKAKAGGTGTFQAFCPTAKGTPKWWDVLVAPMFNSTGEIEHLLVVSRDMTARKQVDEALEFLADASHILSSSLDYKTTLKQITGLVLPRLADFCFFDVLLPDATLQRVALAHAQPAQAEQFDQAFQSAPPLTATHHPVIRVLTTGRAEIVFHVDEDWMQQIATSPEHLEVIHNLHIQSLISLPLIARGRTIGVLTCCVSSLSGRHYTPYHVTLATELADRAALAIDNARLYYEAQEELRTRRQLEEERTQLLVREHAALTELDHFFSLSLDLLCVFKLDGSFKKINAAFERTLGYSQQELFAHPFSLWVHPDDQELYQQALQQLKMGIPLHYFEHRCCTKDGSLIWIAWTALPVVEEDIIYAVGHDITEYKEREEQKDTFISMAGHELRTPLTAIKASLQLAVRRIQQHLNRTEALSDESQAIIHEILPLLLRAQRQTTMQTRLIDDLLDALRIQSDKLHIEPTSCDLLSIVREVVEDQRSVTPTRTITLDLPTTETVPVMVDAGRIGQVLSNYIINALKYSEETQPISVGVTTTEQETRVWVRDHGSGLSREAQEQIWDRFYQVRGSQKSSGSRGAGLGLGLYICRALIARHGGQVGVESTPGQGSTFWFALPTTRTEEALANSQVPVAQDGS